MSPPKKRTVMPASPAKSSRTTAPPCWIVALSVFALTATLYSGLASWVGRTKSPTMAYYPALAEAFLDGRLDLGNPEPRRDLTPYGGVWYLAFPPLPALIMMPEAWVRGSEGVNSVRYSVVFGAAAAAFVFLLLDALSRRGWTHLSLTDNLWLTGLFAFGSVALYMSLAGTVWLTSQVVAVAFIAAAAWLSVEAASPFMAGTALALALLARSNLVLLWPFLLGLAVQRLRADGRAGPGPAMAWAAGSLLPALLAGTLLLGYNQARFDDPLDFGYATMNVSPDLSEGFQRYGQFDLAFLPRNLKWMLFGLPLWNEECGRWAPNPWGMSLLLTMPVVAFVYRAAPRTPWRIGAWAAIGLTLPVLLLYHNTGYYQFGYRFSLDFLVPIIALLAAAGRDSLSPLFRALIATGIAINFVGMAWFFERWCVA